MKLLVLGGTKFLGRHVVDAGLARGDEVTIFTRGQTNPDLYPDVEHLVGDRDGSLDALTARSWDGVVDTSGYVPRVVRQSAELLRDSVGRYVFVSSISVYDDFSEPVDESSPVAALDDPATEEIMEAYGALKAACEDVVEEVYGDRSARVRRPDRRPVRPDRPLHVLAAAHRARRRRARAWEARCARAVRRRARSRALARHPRARRAWRDVQRHRAGGAAHLRATARAGT